MQKTSKRVSLWIVVSLVFSTTHSSLFAPQFGRRQNSGSISRALKKSPNAHLTLAQLDPNLMPAQESYATQSDTSSDSSSLQEQFHDEELKAGRELISQTALPDDAINEKKIIPTLERPGLMKDMFSLPLEFQQQEERQKEEEKSAEKTLAQMAESTDEERIEFNFENADLKNFVHQIEDIFDVTFIPDEAITPLPEGSKPLTGNKITFRTHSPLTRKEAWSLFLTFMSISGLAIVQTAKKNMYRLQTIETARRAAVPAFIGVKYTDLPDNDEIIRYVYFIENSTVDAMQDVVEKLKSSAASLVVLRENKAFILTDKAYNIKTLMKIVRELDQVSMPQSMSVLKLRKADAQQVKSLYDSLVQTNAEQPRTPGTMVRRRQNPSSIFFPENTRIIAEPRTNALILLGTKDDIEKIEQFILKYVDIDLDQPPSPLYVHQLQFADAESIAQIMSDVTRFGEGTPAGQAGGVRGIDKYLKPMSFVAEKSTNRLIIKGDYDDYLKAKAIIEQLDEAQPQVAIEVLILSIRIEDIKEMGTQIRNKYQGTDGFSGPNINFQTSGLRAGGAPQGIVENPDGNGAQRLLGNLLNLVTGAGPGNTILTLGQDIFGVWGLFQLLQTVTNLEVISNPFLIATNKTTAEVSVGETRRVVTSTISASSGNVDALGNDDAKLKVTITPQINSDGMIILVLRIELTEFTNPLNQTSGNKNSKIIETKTIVADKEVLALGGLIRNTIENNLSKTPLLGDIPVIGWLFKNKRKREAKENLLILISTRIIRPEETAHVNKFTQLHISDYQGTLDSMTDSSEKRDPIHKLMFAPNVETDKKMEQFIFSRHKNSNPEKEIETRTQRRLRRIKERKEREKSSAQEAESKARFPGNEQKISELKNDATSRFKTTVRGGIALSGASSNNNPTLDNPPMQRPSRGALE